MENQPEEITDQHKSIFDEDVIDTSEYDKKIKSAQTSIFVVGGVQMVFGLIQYFNNANEGAERDISLGLMVFISVLFLGLGFWCKKKPFAAIVTALIVYASLVLLDAFLDPTTIYKGIIMKVIIIVYLSKGVVAAKEAQRLKEMWRQV